MHAETALESRLRKALNIAGICRAFEPMQKDDLSAGYYLRLMLDDRNRSRVIDTISLVCSWKSPPIDLSRPKIARDRQKVWITDKWLKFRQTLIL